MKLPRITLITPSFNQGKYIEETIESVIAQRYADLEYIVIDGGSNDATVEILKKYSDKISFWVSEKDNGQAHAINKGLERATGDVVCWLNSDDLLEEGSLHTVGETFANDPELLAVFGRIKMFNQDGAFRRSGSILSATLEETLGYGRVSQPAMFFKTSAYREIGKLNDKLHYLMDMEWYLRFLFQYGQSKITEIDKVFALFRVHDESKTISLAEKFRFERDSLYYDLAIKNNFHAQADFIRKYAKVDERILLINCEGKKDLVGKALNYYIFQLAQEYYYYNVREKAICAFEFVNQDMLTELERRRANTLLRRIKYIPPFIFRFVKSR